MMLSRKEIQQIEFDILVEFDELCKKNSIKYYLCGGTLLGAIRHKGFIPWDDDIDVMISRDEYNKLIALLKHDSSGKYRSIHLGNSDFPYLKVFNLKTKIKSAFVESSGMNHIWIDVFPIDGLPNSEKDVEKLYNKIKKLRAALSTSSYKFERAKTLGRTIVKAFLYPVLKMVGSNRWGTWLDKVAQTYDFDQCEWIGGTVWGYGPQEKLRKSKWLEEVDVVFEGKTFKAPGNWEEYLTNLYGDYMKLPPKEKRINHSIVAWKIE